MAWAADNRRVLYVEKDPVTLLGLRVRVHVLGTDPAQDRARVRGAGRVVLHLGRALEGPALHPAPLEQHDHVRAAVCARRRPRIAVPRCCCRASAATSTRPTTSTGAGSSAPTGRRAISGSWRSPVDAPAGREHWREVVPHRDDVFIAGFDVFREFLALEERAGRAAQGPHPALGRRRASSTSIRTSRRTAWRSAPTRKSTARSCATRTRSLTTPYTTYDYDVRTGERTLLKREPVLGDFDPARYATEYLWVPARDGERVPVALVYRKDCFRRDGTAPLLQYGYGAYGISSDPVVLVIDAVAARPRVRLRDRAGARRPGARPALVRGRPAAREATTRSTTSST